MSHYKHITLEEGEKILVFYTKNYSITYISDIIGRNNSTVSRELSRNTANNEYSAAAAQAIYEKRREKCRPQHKLCDPKSFNYVREMFPEHQWSPEQIAGRLKMENSDISTIYRGIYAGIFNTPEQRNSHGNRRAIRKLRHRGKMRHTRCYVEKRGKMVISNDIDIRAVEAEERRRIGDWEADTVIGSTGGSCLVTLADRKSRFLISQKSDKKTSACIRDVMIDCLKGQPLHSITPDRGKEFARHAEVTEALEGVQFYFPKPHQPWKRGTNENTNGLLREYFPKGQDLSKHSDKYIQPKVDELNKRPGKWLGV